MSCKSHEVQSEELQRAVVQFNGGEWFECHETLEELWVGESGETRDFYQGILQVAVALHHWRNGNSRGATLLMEKGPNLLRRLPAVFNGVDVAGFVAAADRFLSELLFFGEERMDEISPELIPRILLVESHEGESG
jgi:uncharacterized protein